MTHIREGWPLHPIQGTDQGEGLMEAQAVGANQRPLHKAPHISVIAAGDTHPSKVLASSDQLHKQWHPRKVCTLLLENRREGNSTSPHAWEEPGQQLKTNITPQSSLSPQGTESEKESLLSQHKSGKVIFSFLYVTKRQEMTNRSSLTASTQNQHKGGQRKSRDRCTHPHRHTHSVKSNLSDYHTNKTLNAVKMVCLHFKRQKEEKSNASSFDTEEMCAVNIPIA